MAQNLLHASSPYRKCATRTWSAYHERLHSYLLTSYIAQSPSKLKAVLPLKKRSGTNFNKWFLILLRVIIIFFIWHKLNYVSVWRLKILINYACLLFYTRSKGLVPLSEVSSSQLIAYDHERDLLPMMLASCSYSLEMGRETQLQYNWETLEKQIIDRFIRGRRQVEFEVSNFLYNSLYWKEIFKFKTYKF